MRPTTMQHLVAPATVAEGVEILDESTEAPAKPPRVILRPNVAPPPLGRRPDLPSGVVDLRGQETTRQLFSPRGRPA